MARGREKYSHSGFVALLTASGLHSSSLSCAIRAHFLQMYFPCGSVAANSGRIFRSSSFFNLHSSRFDMIDSKTLVALQVICEWAPAYTDDPSILAQGSRRRVKRRPAAGMSSGSVKLWDMNSLVERQLQGPRKTNGPESTRIIPLAWSRDSRSLVSCGDHCIDENGIIVWDARKGYAQTEIELPVPGR